MTDLGDSSPPVDAPGAVRPVRPLRGGGAAEFLGDVPALRALVETLPAFASRFDADLRLRYINRVTPGHVLEEVIGASLFDFLPPESHAQHREAIGAAHATGVPQRFTTRGSDGSSFDAHYESIVMSVDDPDGRRGCWIIALDVSEHVQQATALAASERWLRLAVDATELGLWSFDAATGVVVWNDKMRQVTGVDTPLPMDRYLELVHPEDRDRVSRGFVASMTGEQTFVNHRLVRPDGTVRWVACFGDINYGPGGEVVSMRGGTLDITTQHDNDDRLRHAQKMDTIGNLTAGVAHNFNNLLAIILPGLDLLRPSVAPAARELLDEVSRAGHRAADLVAQLMTFAGQRPSEAFATIRLEPLVERVVLMCRHTFGRNLVIEYGTVAPLRPVRVASGAIEQVILNLLVNARDAVADEGMGRIAVTLAPTTLRAGHPAIAVRVTDNGHGVSAAHHQRMFEPFFTTKSPGHGTGLGLATSRAIVQEHGGELRLVTVPGATGRGATFEVVLPCSDGDLAIAPDRASTSSPRLATVGRVLVVDDEASLRRLVTEVLIDLGHDARGAGGLEVACALIRDGFVPDLVLLDRSMPGPGPVATIAALRELVGAAPIVFFTGQDVPPAEATLVDGILSKPLGLAEIETAVGLWLSRRPRR